MGFWKSLLGKGNTNKLKAAAFKEKLKQQRNAQLVDVRSQAEFKQGHLRKARNIDILLPNFEQQSKSLKKDRPVFVYCQRGARSARAARRLKKFGFEQVYDLKGGFLAWQYAGFVYQ